MHVNLLRDAVTVFFFYYYSMVKKIKKSHSFVHNIFFYVSIFGLKTNTQP